MTKKTDPEAKAKEEPAIKASKKTTPPPKQVKAAKKPIESIGLKAMRAVNLNADDETESSAKPKQPAKKVISPLAALKNEPTEARPVEVTNGRITLDSALNNIADQRRLMAQNIAKPQLVEKPILKELEAMQRK